MVKIIIYWENYHVTQRKIFYQVFEKSDQWVGKKIYSEENIVSIHGQLLQLSEAATRGALWEKVFPEILQISQENTCARVSLPIKF